MKGNRIKQLREEKGLKQEDLARELCVAPSTIGMYERDEREPNDNITLKIAEFFGVSTDYLLGKTDIRNSSKLNINDADIAFFNGIKGLNEINKEILKNIYEGLIAKQEQEEKNNKK